MESLVIRESNISQKYAFNIEWIVTVHRFGYYLM